MKEVELLSHVDELRRRVSPLWEMHTDPQAQLLVESATGCVAFFACALASQFAQGCLRISTRTLLLPRSINFATVCVGSSTATVAAEYRQCHRRDGSRFPKVSPLHHELRSMICGLVVFALLGGRALSFTPSSLVAVGAFGRRSASIAAGARYANSGERDLILSLGRKFGCHTCGRRAASFVADHQPPLKIARQRRKLALLRRLLPSVARSKYRYFPQCARCSKLQAAALRAPKFSPNPISHIWTLRPYHSTGGFLPPLLEFGQRLSAFGRRD